MNPIYALLRHLHTRQATAFDLSALHKRSVAHGYAHSEAAAAPLVAPLLKSALLAMLPEAMVGSSVLCRRQSHVQALTPLAYLLPLSGPPALGVLLLLLFVLLGRCTHVDLLHRRPTGLCAHLLHSSQGWRVHPSCRVDACHAQAPSGLHPCLPRRQHTPRCCRWRRWSWRWRCSRQGVPMARRWPDAPHHL